MRVLLAVRCSFAVLTLGAGCASKETPRAIVAAPLPAVVALDGGSAEPATAAPSFLWGSHPPQAPPTAPVDPKLEVESWFFEGANGTHAWLHAMFASDPQPDYDAVVDLATHCVVESYPTGNRLRAVFAPMRELWAETYGQKPAPNEDMDAKIASTLDSAKAEVQWTVGMGARFDKTSLWNGSMAWNKEGPHVFVAAGLLYHSLDGGRSFRRVDDHAASQLTVSPDGRMLVYHRCQQPEAHRGRPTCQSEETLAAIALDTPHFLPREIANLGRGNGYAFSEGFSADGHALVWRTDGQGGCLEFIDPRSGAVTRKSCVTDPHFTDAQGKPALVKFSALTTNEKFMALDWQGTEKRRLVYESPIFDTASAALDRTLVDWQLHGLLDDGAALVKPWSEGSGDAMYLWPRGQPKRLLWHDPMLYRDVKTGRALIESAVRTRRKLGPNACKMVRIENSRPG